MTSRPIFFHPSSIGEAKKLERGWGLFGLLDTPPPEILLVIMKVHCFIFNTIHNQEGACPKQEGGYLKWPKPHGNNIC